LEKTFRQVKLFFNDGMAARLQGKSGSVSTLAREQIAYSQNVPILSAFGPNTPNP
jgi:hypothetical protein